MLKTLCRELSALGAGACLLAGCTLARFNLESKELSTSNLLTGRISATVPWARPVVIVVWIDHNGRFEPSRRILLDQPGSFEALIPKGRYRVLAFGDSNGNLALDSGEPSGTYSSASTDEEATPSIEVALTENEISAWPLPISRGRLASIRSSRCMRPGQIVRLDDESFSERNGKRAYWAPFTSLEERGAVIYFLEPFDPRRIPVLFVHGATGTPRDWRFVIDHLDRTRFQPWIYSYPSGAGAALLSELLYRQLSILHERYRFATLQIAAHSFGGLVVRNFLGSYHDRFSYVRLFVSFSTPWAGEERARLAPSRPAWDDVRPGGPFLVGLFQKRLPPEVDFHLFFGYRGNRDLFRSANDGTVTLRSQLTPASQSEARRVHGFAENHQGILSSPEAVATFNDLLRADSPLEEGTPRKRAGIPERPVAGVTPQR